MSATAFQIALLGFVLGCAVIAAVLRDILAVVVTFGAYSLGMSVLWLALHAPDVGLTEAAVGTGVLTLLLLLAVAQSATVEGGPRFESLSRRTAAALAAFVGVFATTLPALPRFGDPGTPVADSRVTRFYLAEASSPERVDNAVTLVLADFRVFDSLGEAVVVFATAVGMLVVLRRGEFA